MPPSRVEDESEKSDTEEEEVEEDDTRESVEVDTRKSDKDDVEEMPSPAAEDTDSKKWTLWAAASYAFVMLVIGLPLWWKTTTVQRVPLPYADMLNLHQFFLDQLQISIPIHLKGFPVTEDEISDFNRVYQVKDTNNTKFQYNLAQLTDWEVDIISASNTLEDIDAKFCAKVDVGDDSSLYLYNISRSDFIQNRGDGSAKVFLGNCKSIYYLSDSPSFKMDKVWEVLEQFAIPTVENELSGAGGINANEFQLPLSAGYDILWSLLVPEPELVDVTWDIEAGVKKFIQPMLQKLESVAEFSLRSQTLYYVRLNVKPKMNPITNVHEIPYEQLPLVINPVESKLTSFVSQNPALNFLIYVAPCDVSPMYLLDEEGQALNSSNSFFVPRWGGIQVYNAPCPKEGSQDGGKHAISVKQVMEIVISQFRALIGVQTMNERTKILNFRGSAIRDWEVDLIVRKRLAELMFTASNTLKSLGNLLDQITNIVVRDEVGIEVEKSVESLKHAYNAVMDGKLKLAQRHALDAFKSSEIAFHHPSNLAQLYFPDDQKYAIYIPLFLPVGIPVLLSLRLIIQEFVKYKNSDVVKTKSE